MIGRYGMLRLLKKKGAYHPKHTRAIHTKQKKNMRTETTPEQKEALMQAAWTILTKAAKEQKTSTSPVSNHVSKPHQACALTGNDLRVLDGTATRGPLMKEIVLSKQ